MITFGIQNFWRNIWLSLVTVLIVVLNLFLMSVVMSLNVVGQQTLTAVRQKIDLSVYFKAQTTDDQLEQVHQDLLKVPEVATVKVVTRAQHLADFQQKQQNNPLIKSALTELGDNPLGPGLIITATGMDNYGPIVKTLQAEKYKPIVDDIGNDFQTNQNLITKLSGIISRIQFATIWLTILFAFIAVLMVYNTIRVNIYSHREEIGIMKLVGASDAFIRGPFIVASLMYGILASLITTGVFIPILTLTNPFFSNFFAGFDVNVLAYFHQHIFTILGLEVVVGAGLSSLSSVFAIGRYLRV